ncbi:hypothetical protein ERN12_02950 [Rhodobacteraceae bacterium]|nr:hypothetical protein ERN12_02950 [Paracoccaceae bacterium]
MVPFTRTSARSVPPSRSRACRATPLIVKAGFS